MPLKHKFKSLPFTTELSGLPSSFSFGDIAIGGSRLVVEDSCKLVDEK
jgi:hypothetical protein